MCWSKTPAHQFRFIRVRDFFGEMIRYRVPMGIRNSVLDEMEKESL